MGRFDGKTEKATPQRRREARREGTVARSPEVSAAAGLVAGMLVLRVLAPHGLTVLSRDTRALFTSADAAAIVGDDLVGIAGRMAAALLLPFLAAATLAAVAAGVGQVGFSLTPKAAKPKLSNVSPKRNLERFRPSTLSWELGRTFGKIGLLFAIAWGPIDAWRQRPVVGRPVDVGIATILELTWAILVRATLLAVVIAVADYAWNRHKTEKQLKMSKDDVKREAKDQEGDPQIRGMRRRRQMELSRNRMLRDVVTADVVVVNPTHYAVALRYTLDDGAPRVVAKGVDNLAARIRKTAGRHGVPITQDKPLARALYRRCKVGQHVPAALYDAVAVVLAVAYRRLGRGPRDTQRVAA